MLPVDVCFFAVSDKEKALKRMTKTEDFSFSFSSVSQGDIQHSSRKHKICFLDFLLEYKPKGLQII